MVGTRPRVGAEEPAVAQQACSEYEDTPAVP